MNRRLKFFSQLLILAGVAFSLAYFGELYQEHKYQVEDSLTYEQAASLRSSGAVKASADLHGLTKGKSIYVSDAKLSLNTPKAWPAFTLYPISGTTEITLVNNLGQIVHTWKNIDTDRARLLPNGNLLVLHGSKYLMKDEPWKSMRKQVSEYDWQGNLVWSYKDEELLHHDVQRLPNGNTLLLKKTSVPKEYLKGITDSLRKTIDLKADSLIEVNPDGNLVWKWNSWEHFDINDCGVRACLGAKDKEQNPRLNLDDLKDWTHINTIGVLPENKWYDQGDQRFKPGNIIIMPRNFWKMYIVDKDSGKLVWEYHGDYKGGLIGGHEPSMIAKGLVGEGNIMILDNGNTGRNKSSFILEINPQTNKTEWVYDVGPDFFTHARGSVQRLPNGNTLISEDHSGRVFEVTREFEKVWEYGGTLLSVRARKYGPDYAPQLAELTL